MRFAGLLLLLAALPAFAADKAAQLDALLARYHQLGLFNGSALVAENGKPLLRKGYGDANMEWRIPNAPDTRFRLGSITKQFTAALVMHFAEKGQIQLQAPIGRYLPDYPKAQGDRVTVHQLLNHTSGIPGYTELPEFGRTMREPLPHERFLKIFSEMQLLFEPGTKFSYNNSGYYLLGVILEKATGKSYETLLREVVLDPLNMRQTGYDGTRPLIEKRAAGYDSTLENGYVNTSYLDMGQPYAAGSMYSTVDDLLLWAEALHGGKVAGAEKMFQPGLAGYGYGLAIRKNPAVIEHGGGINGFNTVLTRDVDSKRVYVLLNNTGGAPLNAMVAGLRAILEDKQPEMPKVPAAPALYKTWKQGGLAAALEQWKSMKAGGEYDTGEGQLTRLAGAALTAGKKDDALQLAKAVEEMAPKSVGAAMLMGRVRQALGHRVEAIAAYAKAIELSDTPRALLTLTESIRELSDLSPKAAPSK